MFLKIGSAPDSDVVIADASALHAKLENFMGKWTVTDQMSDTGTRLNGESAYSSEIKAGDVIEIGSAKIRVQAGEGAPPSKPAARAAAAVPLEPPPGLEFKTESLADMISRAEPVKLREATPAEIKAAVALEGRATLREEVQRMREPTPQELFAREMASRPAQVAAPVSEPARGSSPQDLFAQDLARRAPAQKKGTPVIGFVIIGAIILCVVGVIVQSISEEMSSEPPPWETNEMPGSEHTSADPARPGTRSPAPAADNKRLSSADEKKYRDRIQAVSKEKTSWEDRLAKLDAIEAELTGKQHSLEYEFERYRRYLEQGLLLEMSKRSSKDQTDVYDLAEAKKFDEALKRLEALKTYEQSTEYHKKLSATAGIKGYVDEKIEELTGANATFIAEQFLEADKALCRRDYAAAQPPVSLLLEKARLGADLKEFSEREIEWDKQYAREQQEGAREGVIPLFDKRKWKLPPAPRSTLLEDGDNSRWKFLNLLPSRLKKDAARGAFKGVKTVLYGRDAVVGEPDSYRLALTFTRVMRGMGGEAHEYTFTVLRQTADLPAATLLSLYEQLENPTRDERLGMLLFCYENGLMDDAPRLAWKLWKADESVKPDLDALMAAKLGIEVPQGGFIERDGRLETK